MITSRLTSQDLFLGYFDICQETASWTDREDVNTVSMRWLTEQARIDRQCAMLSLAGSQNKIVYISEC